MSDLVQVGTENIQIHAEAFGVVLDMSFSTGKLSYSNSDVLFFDLKQDIENKNDDKRYNCSNLESTPYCEMK